ncbi:alpha/beta hydrolase [Nocardioides sp. NPDC101246]|uniref:alpha/beta hydrolase n=1 Tax=Nocardioides sp. NPDC101246 TaxID=3364336 RepID=UPI0037F40873
MTDTQQSKSTSAFYLRGGTPFFASQYDQRLLYCLYVPRDLDETEAPFPLVVAQHGTARTAERYRDALRGFADANRAIVLAPLFPAGIIDPDDFHNFKFIEYRGIRFDHALLAIVDEVAARYPIAADRFYLHGFSGGGQFVHRFLYLHPDRLAGVSIGAPGRITQLDDSLPWWLGTQGMRERFGIDVDIDAIRRVPIQMVVGDEDTDTWEINNRGESNWMDGAEKAGSTRIERLQTLQRNFAEHGIDVRFDTVPGVAHRGSLILPAVERYFGELIAESRAHAG